MVCEELHRRSNNPVGGLGKIDVAEWLKAVSVQLISAHGRMLRGLSQVRILSSIGPAPVFAAFV